MFLNNKKCSKHQGDNSITSNICKIPQWRRYPRNNDYCLFNKLYFYVSHGLAMNPQTNHSYWSSPTSKWDQKKNDDPLLLHKIIVCTLWYCTVECNHLFANGMMGLYGKPPLSEGDRSILFLAWILNNFATDYERQHRNRIFCDLCTPNPRFFCSLLFFLP